MLTYFDIDVSMEWSYYSDRLGEGKSMIEVCLEMNEKLSSVKNELDCNNLENNALEELNVSLREATYYLIQFFYKTNKKYSCTQTKLGKLLSVLAFKYAINGIKLFNETIYRYPPCCGTYIKELSMIANKDIYVRDINQDNTDKTSAVDDEFDECVEIPERYKSIRTLTVSIKKEIKSLFREFGAYPANELGSLLNPIVEKVVNNENDVIDLSKFKDIEKEALCVSETDKGNKIVEYIFSN